MHIAVDLRALAGKQTSGVKVYLYSVLEELFHWDKKNTYLFWWNSPTTACPLKIPRSPRFRLVHTRYSNRYLNLRLRLQSQPLLDQLLLQENRRNQGKLDVFWLPDLRPVAVSPACKLVVTLHDLSTILYPEFFSLRTRLWSYFLRPLEIATRADKIITVSQTTANDLQQFSEIEPAKISVTQLGIASYLQPIKSRAKLQAVKNKYQLPEKFALTLSTLEPRKNLAMLVRAFARLKAETDSSAELVLAGDFDKKIFANPGLSKFLAAQWLHLPGVIAECDKAALISAAEVFCFPSIYEGFGLPALEALACGTPLLAADIPALHETCGVAAQFLPTKNKDAWKIALTKIFSDREKSRQLSTRGLLQARRFTWRETAKATLAAFATTKRL